MSQVGDRIASRYQLQSVAGEGGMATVWRARSVGAAGFSREVAVKEIKSEFGALQSYIDMFVEEARVGSDLAHPNIVQVYDFLEYRGSHYLVMEWVEGIDLSDFVMSYTRFDQLTPWELVAAIGIYALRGLVAAHSRRRPDGVEAPVIHRDVSPTNILLSTNGTVKITDFGLARARDRAYSLTAPGTVKGKLSYLSPEVTYGRSASPKSDQFSLGSVLWEALTGQQLFIGANDIEIFKLIRACEVPPLSDYRPDIPRDMVEIVHRSLARKPSERFPSGAAMIAALTEILDMRSQTSPWELEDQIALAVARASTSLRPPLPLPADEEIALRSFDPEGDPTETGPGRLLGAGGAVVEFAEYSDSDVATRPEYVSDSLAPSARPLASRAAENASAAANGLASGLGSVGDGTVERPLATERDRAEPELRSNRMRFLESKHSDDGEHRDGDVATGDSGSGDDDITANASDPINTAKQRAAEHFETRARTQPFERVRRRASGVANESELGTAAIESVDPTRGNESDR